MLQNIDDVMRAKGISLIKDVFSNLDTNYNIELPSQWASANRYLSSGISNRPGLINHTIAPHMIEIQDCFHPDSGIRQVAIMKSTQSLATTTLENVIGWAIKHKLHNILYILSTVKIGKIRGSAAIDTLIDDSNLKKYIKPNSERSNRKRADSPTYKELAGKKRFMIATYNSLSDAKSLPWDLIIFDELEDAPAELGNQGDPEKMFEMRSTTARHAKICKLSTPSWENGRIHKAFLNGDQRYYFVPCPLCGEMQVLELYGGGLKYGLSGRYEETDGRKQLIQESVVYICKHCGKGFEEYHKQDILNAGKWIPTAQPINANYRSYHISNLMSPIMFFSWSAVLTAFLDTKFGSDILKFKNFSIDVLGRPWQKRQDAVGWEQALTQSKEYKICTVDDDKPIMTGGADIQKNRIEYQVVAWGNEMSSQVIDYHVFYGDTAAYNDVCWKNFLNCVYKTSYSWRGRELRVSRVAVDSGYNPERDTAKSEAGSDIKTEGTVTKTIKENFPKLLPIKGASRREEWLIKEPRDSKGKIHKILVNTGAIKDLLFDEYERGLVTLNRSYGADYFKGLFSEVYAEQLDGSWEYKQIYRANEPLDTWVYARAAAEKLKLSLWSPADWEEYAISLLVDEEG